jgi:hypothetical protein
MRSRRSIERWRRCWCCRSEEESTQAGGLLRGIVLAGRRISCKTARLFFRILRAFLVALLAACCLTASSGAQDLASASLFSKEAFPLPVIGGGFGGGNGGVQGNAFILQPLWSTLGGSGGGSILFLEPDVVWREEGQWFASLGLGYRHWFEGPAEGEPMHPMLAVLLSDGWFLGGNVFLDGMQSVEGQTFYQMTGGLEVGTRYFTLRANYYLPLTDAQRFGEVRTVSLRETHSSSSSEHTDYRLQVGPVGGAGNFLTDIRAFATTHRSSSARSRVFQTTRTYGLYEEALEGWDLEASLLVPGLDRYTDLRFIAGLYGFASGQFSTDIEGWKLGLEWRPVPALILIASWYDDDLRDGDWFTGIGFEIPLGTSWEELCRRHTHTLKERMIEPVHRQRQITLASGSKLERVEVGVVRLSTSSGRSSITIDSGPLVMGFVPVPGSIVTAFGRQFLVLADGTLQLLGPTPSGPGLIVVPEPSRGLLLIMGLACAVLRRRRRQG